MTPFLRRASILSSPPPARALARRWSSSSKKCLGIGIEGRASGGRYQGVRGEEYGSVAAGTGGGFGHAKLRQHAKGRFGVKEGDQLATGAIKGLLVNQPHTRGGSLLELGFHVVGPEGDVMNAAV